MLFLARALEAVSQPARDRGGVKVGGAVGCGRGKCVFVMIVVKEVVILYNGVEDGCRMEGCRMDAFALKCLKLSLRPFWPIFFLVWKCAGVGLSLRRA